MREILPAVGVANVVTGSGVGSGAGVGSGSGAGSTGQDDKASTSDPSQQVYVLGGSAGQADADLALLPSQQVTFVGHAARFSASDPSQQETTGTTTGAGGVGLQNFNKKNAANKASNNGISPVSYTHLTLPTKA